MACQAFAPWFLLPPDAPSVPSAVTSSGGSEANAAGAAHAGACTACGLPHTEPAKLASLFFALQTFSADIGLPGVGGSHGHGGDPAAASVRCISFEGVAVRFAQHHDDTVPVTAVRVWDEGVFEWSL